MSRKDMLRFWATATVAITALAALRLAYVLFW